MYTENYFLIFCFVGCTRPKKYLTYTVEEYGDVLGDDQVQKKLTS